MSGPPSCPDTLVIDLPQGAAATWLEDLTLYADDFLSQIIFHSEAELSRGLRSFGKLIQRLEANGMKLSAGKSVNPAKVIGAKGPRIWKKRLTTVSGSSHVGVPISVALRYLAVVKQHRYLGATNTRSDGCRL